MVHESHICIFISTTRMVIPQILKLIVTWYQCKSIRVRIRLVNPPKIHLFHRDFLPIFIARRDFLVCHLSRHCCHCHISQLIVTSLCIGWTRSSASRFHLLLGNILLMGCLAGLFLRGSFGGGRAILEEPQLMASLKWLRESPSLVLVINDTKLLMPLCQVI
jgi:hypothetical protein